MHKAIVCPTSFKLTATALFVLNYQLRESPLFAVANRFESRCQSNTADAVVFQNLSLFILADYSTEIMLVCGLSFRKVIPEQ